MGNRPFELPRIWGGSSELAVESPDMLDTMCSLQIHYRKYIVQHIHVRHVCQCFCAKMNANKATRRRRSRPTKDHTVDMRCDIRHEKRNTSHASHGSSRDFSTAGSRQMQHMRRSAIPISHIDPVQLRAMVFRSSSATVCPFIDACRHSRSRSAAVSPLLRWRHPRLSHAGAHPAHPTEG